MTVISDFVAGVDVILDTLGSDMVLTDVNGGARNVRGAITSVGKDDEPLVGAVGVDTRILYLKNLNPRPVKFDVITTGTGDKYTIHSVHVIEVNNGVAAIQCVVDK